MAFKKTTRNLDFADLAMATCLEQNRSIKLTLLNVPLTLQFASGLLLTNYAQLGLSVFINGTERVKQLNNTINWARVESILLSHYTACPVKFLIDAYAIPRPTNFL